MRIISGDHPVVVGGRIYDSFPAIHSKTYSDGLTLSWREGEPEPQHPKKIPVGSYHTMTSIEFNPAGMPATVF